MAVTWVIADVLTGLPHEVNAEKITSKVPEVTILRFGLDEM